MLALEYASFNQEMLDNDEFDDGTTNGAAWFFSLLFPFPFLPSFLPFFLHSFIFYSYSPSPFTPTSTYFVFQVPFVRRYGRLEIQGARRHRADSGVVLCKMAQCEHSPTLLGGNLVVIYFYFIFYILYFIFYIL